MIVLFDSISHLWFQEVHSYSPQAQYNLVGGRGQFWGHSQLEGSQSMSNPAGVSSFQGQVQFVHTEAPPIPR